MRRLAGIFVVISIGCGGSSQPSVATVSVQASGNGLLTALGATVQLSASAKDAGGLEVPGAAISWSSADTSVAVVDQNGLVTAVSNGSAIITATSGSVPGSLTVTVAQAAQSVTVNPGSQSIGPAVAFTFTAQALDANGHPLANAGPASWTVDDAAIATIDGASGTVVANRAITSLLTTHVHAALAGFSASATLTVDPAMAPVVSVAVSRGPGSLGSVGDTLQISAQALNEAGNVVPGVVFSWSSSHPDFAAVDGNGLVTARANGTANITASGGGKSGSIAVVVEQVATEVVLAAPAQTALDSLDATLQLQASVNDARHHAIPGAPLVWAPSDATVATVDANGLVTATGNGQVIITASSGSLHDQVTLTVQQVVRSVAISPPALAIAPNTAADFVANPMDRLGHSVPQAPAATWRASDARVSIDAAGHAAAGAFSASFDVTITATVAGIDGSATLTIDPSLTPVDRVVIVGGGVSLPSIGASAQLSAQAQDALGNPLPGHVISWSVSDGTSDVVTVATTGLVTAVANGQKTIHASTSGVSANTVITVQQVLASIRVATAAQGSSTTLASLGETLALKATGVDANNHDIPGGTFAWQSDSANATVDQSGLVTAVANGPANITAAQNGITSTPAFLVTVKQAVAAIVVSSGGASTSLTSLGDTLQLTATAFDGRDFALVPQPAFTWSPSLGAAAVADANGLVLALSNGTTNIQAAAGGKIGSLPVTVQQVATSVVISGPATLASFEATAQLAASALDARAHAVPGQTFTWQSANSGVVAVSATGLVAAQHTNAATTITATNGVGLSSLPFTVTVAQAVAAIRVDPAAGASTTLTSIGDTLQLSATAVDANGFDLESPPNGGFTWSLNPACSGGGGGGGGTPVGVDAAGLVTAQSNGSASVFACAKGRSGSLTVTVAQVAAAVTVTPPSTTLSLSAAPSVTLQASVKDARGKTISSANFSWRSSDPSIATISANGGLATAVAAGGPVTITATFTNPPGFGTTSGTASLTVNP